MIAGESSRTSPSRPKTQRPNEQRAAQKKHIRRAFAIRTGFRVTFRKSSACEAGRDGSITDHFDENPLQLAEGICGRDGARGGAADAALAGGRGRSIRSRNRPPGRCSMRKSPRTVPIAWATTAWRAKLRRSTALPVKPVQPKLKESSEKAADATRVEIEAPDLCGRYTARVLRGVKVQPSPGLAAAAPRSHRRRTRSTTWWT